MAALITSSVDSRTSKNDRLYENMSNNPLNKTPDRIEFIRLLLENTQLKPMFEMDTIVEKNHYKDVKDVTKIFDKKNVVFRDAMCSLGNFLVYIKSGTTGHTFKGMSIPDPSRPDMELNYAVKIVDRRI